MKPSKSDWPKSVHVGNATVKIYKRITMSGNVGFQIAFIDANGKRKMLAKSDENEALKIARQKAEIISMFGAHVAAATPREIAAYVSARDMLAPFNIKVSDAVEAVTGWLKIYRTLDEVDRALTNKHFKSPGAVCEPTDPGFAELQKTASKTRRKSRKQLLERGAYSAALRARPASTWENMPPMVSIPFGPPTKSPSSPTNKKKL